MQETFLAWAKKGISENIPTALVGAADTDMEIEEALDGKFDAILAALVEKSLSDKVIFLTSTEFLVVCSITKDPG